MHVVLPERNENSRLGNIVYVLLFFGIVMLCACVCVRFCSSYYLLQALSAPFAYVNIFGCIAWQTLVNGIALFAGHDAKFVRLHMGNVRIMGTHVCVCVYAVRLYI